MKKYKLERKQRDQSKRNPNRFKRNDEMIKLARKMALEDFKYGWSVAEREVDEFGYQFYSRIKDRVNIQYSDVAIMWPVYKKCIRLLRENKRKAEFLNKSYVPLEEDLFNV